MRRTAAIILLAASLAGCGGQYILTAGDQVAPAGQDAAVVARLQRTEFWIYAQSVHNEPLRFRIGNGLQRNAFTDRLGYAGTTVPVPDMPGRFPMTIDVQDKHGDEAAAAVPVYVWEPNAPVVAVDLDCLPDAGTTQAESAARALWRLAEHGNICYLTRRPVKRHARAHESLAERNCPDGPILLWHRQRWHIIRGRWRMPKVVVETRLVSQLPELRRRFPRLAIGICDGPLAGEAFVQAGMRCVVIGSGSIGQADVLRYRDWTDLAERGVP